MKNTTFLLGALVLFTACTTQTTGTSIHQQNRNPLTASRYGDELADTMANLIINKSPLANASGSLALIHDSIQKGKDISATARDEQRKGMMGGFISITQDTTGYILLLGSTVYLSSDFITDPGVDLHLYLTETVDPRDVQFPDPTAIDLGTVQSVYGAQEYTVPAIDTSKLRTAVLWDAALGQLYGFAQMSR